MKILVAEDDLTSRTMLMAVLKKQGHDVIAVTNGQEAWDVLERADAPRMLILDWLMPEVDGAELCRKIRKIETNIPPYIILLTVRGEKKDVAIGLSAGADDYLAKPFDPVELGARIDVGERVLKLQEKLHEKIRQLEDAISQIKTLSGIVPICASCKKIRDDEGYWNQVEAYISAHSSATFSHGICPECAKILYPDEYDLDENLET
jgi:DNA-binding response OmpR family regulator